MTFSNTLHVGTQPAIDHDSADFSADCEDLNACSGEHHAHRTRRAGVRVSAIQPARFPRGDPGLGAPNPTGAAALGEGAVVQVDVRSDTSALLQEPGGYRMMLRAATQ